uniref:Reverse transcriptase Ty1/copia-type domain-containing protein n=1 Tax=Chenopodium quinoa TaxID=63459 RepID=A0A803ND66_CHEQI
MYTTMDCDLVETKYFYHHLRSQGESSGDDLSWLTYPEIGTDPKEQVDTTAETTDNIIQFDQIGTITNDHTTLSEDPPSNKVCNPDSSHNTESTNLSSEDESIEQNILSKTPERSESGNEDVESEQVSYPENYVLPPRSTRVIPPKRYNPDFEAQRSKYPVGKPVMKKFKYKQSNSDHTLFFKRKGELTTCLIIYVDDMIITGDDIEEIEQLKGKLFQEFEMKDLGNLKYFLGIEVLRSKGGIFISQRKYILDFLTETGMINCKPADTPMIMNHGLQIIEGSELVNQTRYQRLVGKLIYLSHTQPDLAYVVGVVSRFMHKPQKQHLEAVYRILRYLKKHLEEGFYMKVMVIWISMLLLTLTGEEIVTAENPLPGISL